MKVPRSTVAVMVLYLVLVLFVCAVSVRAVHGVRWLP